tara:strand:- start:509 stop:1081 length:573 start_codon:yes stop_codon:yes gene_type:complete
MLKLSQKKPKLVYSNDVIDVVQFGSSVIEGRSPNDLDIAVIYNKILLKEQLIESQKIKRQLEKLTDLKIHIKSFDYYSLLRASNFARESIIFNGISLINNDYFSKSLFSFEPKLQIYYSLNKFEKKDKIRFNYLINGKKKSYGLLRKYDGKIVKPGLLEIPPEYEEIFIDALDNFKVDYKIKKTFFVNGN